MEGGEERESLLHDEVAPTLFLESYPTLFSLSSKRPVIVPGVQPIKFHITGCPPPALRVVHRASGRTVAFCQSPPQLPNYVFMLDASVLEGGKYFCFAENCKGSAQIDLLLVVDDGVVVNTCPVGNPVLSLTPSAAATLLFTAHHQVHTLNDISFTQAMALAAASQGDLSHYVKHGFEEDWNVIPSPNPSGGAPRVWCNHSEHAQFSDLTGFAVRDSEGTVECGMCEEEVPQHGGVQCLNDCGHNFCRECMRLFVESLLEDIESFTHNRFKCPDPACGTFLHPGLVMHLLSPAKQERFLQLTVRADGP